MENYYGEMAALATAFCWSITATSFEVAGKKVGSLSLNLIRLFIGMFFLMIFTWIVRGVPIPVDASITTWKWLFASGLIGLVIGDLLLFEAFVRIGARISMLIYASVPPMNALLAYIILGESMTSFQIIGMFVTVSGIAMVILVKDTGKKVKLSHPLAGILLAFGGAFGQALGYIIGKVGLESYDAFAATQIRLLAGIIGFSLILTFKGKWKNFFAALKEKEAMKFITLGSFFGPFLGISLSLLAIQYTHPGVASTLTSITPVLLIPVAIFIRKETVHFKEFIGAIVALVGVGLIFLG